MYGECCRVALPPDHSFHCRRHELAMFCDEALHGVDKHDCTVQSAQVPLDHADHQENIGLPAYGFDARDRVRIGHLDGSRVIAQEFVPALGGTIADRNAEEAVLRITTNTARAIERGTSR